MVTATRAVRDHVVAATAGATSRAPSATSAWIVAIAAELVLAVGGSWDNDGLRLRPQGHDANDRPTNVKGALTPTLTTENRTPGEMAARIP
jgi:hypothetical protein